MSHSMMQAQTSQQASLTVVCHAEQFMSCAKLIYCKKFRTCPTSRKKKKLARVTETSSTRLRLIIPFGRGRRRGSEASYASRLSRCGPQAKLDSTGRGLFFSAMGHVRKKCNSVQNCDLHEKVYRQGWCIATSAGDVPF